MNRTPWRRSRFVVHRALRTSLSNLNSPPLPSEPTHLYKHI